MLDAHPTSPSYINTAYGVTKDLECLWSLLKIVKSQNYTLKYTESGTLGQGYRKTGVVLVFSMFSSKKKFHNFF